MDEQPPDKRPEDSDEEKGTPVAIVATEMPVPLVVCETEDERTPDGAACMVTFLHDRRIAQSIVSPEALANLSEKGIFDEARRLGLAAVEREPGIQGRLFALVPAIEFRDQRDNHSEEDEEREPWAESVPSFEDLHAEDESDPEELVPVLLGHIVRFAKDRKHPEDLPSEAADILNSIVSPEKELKTIVDKLIESL